MMKLIDISWPISKNMTSYKNKSFYKIITLKKFHYDKSRDELIILNTHTGTHIDAPAHFIKKGKTIDKVALEKTNGSCKVLNFSRLQGQIREQDLKKHKITKGDIILLKTRNSKKKATGRFDKKFVYLDESGAQYLAKKGIKSVGIDYLGIEHGQPEHPTHYALLLHNIVVIEGLRLGNVSAGTYWLHCLPLALTGTSAAPARAVLVKR